MKCKSLFSGITIKIISKCHLLIIFTQNSKCSNGKVFVYICVCMFFEVQLRSTIVISKSKGVSKTLRDIRTSTKLRKTINRTTTFHE